MAPMFVPGPVDVASEVLATPGAAHAGAYQQSLHPGPDPGGQRALRRHPGRPGQHRPG